MALFCGQGSGSIPDSDSLSFLFYLFCPVGAMVAHTTFNRGARGSSPLQGASPGPASRVFFYLCTCHHSSMVERACCLVRVPSGDWEFIVSKV